MYRTNQFGLSGAIVGMLVALAAGLPTTQAIAQDEARADSVTDEIIVSVRKKDELLKDVPIAISVLTQEDIERRGIRSLSDVTRETPSLIFDEGFAPQDTRVVIRGLSPTRGRPNVAFLQDGVDITSDAVTTAGASLLINPRLFDVERIEVVKGPQSALYGRSAFNGAINYVTKRPGDEFRTNATVDVNNKGKWETTGSVSGPVIKDKLSLGLNAGIWKEDGYFNNSVTGDKAGGTDGHGLAGTALFQFNDRARLYGRMEYTDDSFDPQAQATVKATKTLPIPPSASPDVIDPAVTEVLVPQGSVPKTDDLVIRNSTNPRTGGNDYPGTDREVFRFTLVGEFEFDFGNITSLSHYADADTKQFQDGLKIGDYSALNVGAETNLDQSTNLYSQDLRFSRTDGPFDWTVGALYWKEEVDVDDGSLICFTIPAQNCADLIAPIGTTEPLNKGKWDRETEHWSAYAAIDWRINEQWTFGVEGRYVDEDLDIKGPDAALTIDPFGLLGGPPTAVPPQPGEVSSSDKDSFFAPKATLEWKPNDDLLFYGSVAQGIKPSGISTVTGGAGGFDPDLLRYDQEKVLVYELGGKTSWYDGRLQLNGAAFFQDFTDKQVSTQVPLDTGLLGISPVNADGAEVWGIESEVIWLATENLSFNLSYTWLDTEYTDFKRTSSSVSDLARAGNCAVVQVGGNDTCQIDLSNRDLEDAPDHSFVGVTTYSFPLTSEMDVFADLQVQYQSERNDSAFSVLEYEDYWLTDLRLGLSGEKWQLLGYIDNVLDEDVTRSGFVSPDFTEIQIVGSTFVLPNQGFYNLAPPRTYGMRLSVNF